MPGSAVMEFRKVTNCPANISGRAPQRGGSGEQETRR